MAHRNVQQDVGRGELLAHRLAMEALRLLPPRRRAAGPRPERPRVVLLIFRADTVSGVARTVLNLAEYLAADHDVEVLSVVRRRRRRTFFPRPKGVRFSVVDDHRRRRVRREARWGTRMLRARRGRLVHPASSGARLTTLLTDLRLVSRLRRLDADVVISTRHAVGIIASRLVPRDTVLIGQEHMNLGIRGPHAVKATHRAAREFDAIVVLTETVRRQYEALVGTGVRVVCIPNAVPRLGGGRSDVSRPVIVAAGRLTWQKGFDRLIRAFADIAAQEPEWTLRICGEGPEESRLLRLARELGVEDRIELPGWVEDLPAEMQRASIFALSSRWEGLPMVVLEAMSRGLPVVAYDCPTGPADVVAEGRTGHLVADGDRDGFAAALLDLMRDAPKRRRFGEAAVQRAEDFSLGRVGERWKALLDELLAQGASGTTSGVARPPTGPEAAAAPHA